MPDGMPAPQGQEAPFGASSATGPTPNAGYEAAGMQRLGMMVKQLTELLPMLGAESEPGQAVLKALSSLSKFIQPGSVTPAAERNITEQNMIKNTQQAAMIQKLRQMAMQQAAGQGGGDQGQGAMPPGAQMGARAA